MQSRSSRLDWIGKVLADPDAAPTRAGTAPLRLVAESPPAADAAKAVRKPLGRLLKWARCWRSNLA
jgi:hypothetical protein